MDRSRPRRAGQERRSYEGRERRVCSIALSFLTMVGLALTISSCQPTVPSSDDCESAFNSLPQISVSDEIFDLVSQDVARVLEACQTATEWKTQLKDHPGVVGKWTISQAELAVYFSNACELHLSYFGTEALICAAEQNGQ